jgi:competence protein ComEA
MSRDGEPPDADRLPPGRHLWSRRQNVILLALAAVLFALVVVRLTLDGGWGREPIRVDRTAREQSDPRLDVNTASWLSLSRLPGLGPATAKRIVADRERNGPFASPEDLQRVPGIGPVTVARCRPYLQFPCETQPSPTQPPTQPTADP